MWGVRVRPPTVPADQRGYRGHSGASWSQERGGLASPPEPAELRPDRHPRAPLERRADSLLNHSGRYLCVSTDGRVT